jgi:hypothetical protein
MKSKEIKKYIDGVAKSSYPSIPQCVAVMRQMYCEILTLKKQRNASLVTLKYIANHEAKCNAKGEVYEMAKTGIELAEKS